MSKSLQRWLDNKTINPFRELAQVEDSFERLFSEMLNAKRSNGAQVTEFAPTCDIEEDGNKYMLKFDLPGVTKDQVKVEVNGDQLTVRAERKEEKKSEGKRKFLAEVFYGSYVRSFTLPAALEEKNVDAKFENGVLTVTIPKTEASNTKQIAIQ
ncbi:MAG: Hsp20/alpha crystallin family protein [Pseudobdellovibrio sp.]